MRTSFGYDGGVGWVWARTLKKHAGRTLWFTLGALILPLLMAARCSPSPRARSYGCPGGAASCSSTTLPACINFCAPQPTIANANGSRCVLDPCNQAGLSQPNTYMCPENFSCIANTADPGFGNCRNTDAQVLMGCHVTAGPACPTGTYCRPFGPGLTRPSHITTAYDGICMAPVREGGLCDADFGHPGFLVCEPGTNCLEDPTGVTSTMRCRRPCTSDANCPCETATNPTPANAIRCLATGSSNPSCTACSPNRGNCDTSPGSRCCDGLSTCVQMTVGTASGAMCCHANGVSCSSDAQCCGSSRCGTDGKCAACGQAGSAPGTGGCCTGLNNVAGVCTVPCVWRGATVTTGTSCTIGTGGCTGSIVCRSSGADCVPPAGRPLVDTTCNNVDDDCDGTRDEDWTGTCSPFAIAGCTTPTGGTFVPAMPPTARCVSGVVSCTYGMDDYCRVAGPGNLLN